MFIRFLTLFALVFFFSGSISHAVEPKFTGGHWTLTRSLDNSGTNWKGSKLYFTEATPTETTIQLKGYFVWRVGGVLQGREYFKGRYSKNTRSIKLQGTRLTNYSNLVLGDYYARAGDAKRPRLTGYWDGPGAIPGNWAASWTAPD